MTAQTIANQFSFGSGNLYGVPTNGTSIQPMLLGTLQECSYDISSSIKELYGQNQFAAAVGRGPAKFTGKAKMGAFNSIAWNNFFFGVGSDGSAAPSVSATLSIQVVDREVGSTTTQAYQFANHASGTFVDDLGLTYAVTGNALQKVASAPATGQYSVNASTGTYTVAAADTPANAAGGIVAAYSWLPTTATKVTQTINNAAFPMGAAPTFQIVHHIPYTATGTDITLKIYAAMSSKLTLNFKNEDFTVPEIDFTLFANSAGKVMDLITTY